jgi:hypothetical protein
MTGSGQDLPYCDLVMKGGVTSGVVYPLAITELSQTYRFKCIGGASAGAIAAAAAAAAEMGRESGGFEELRKLPEKIATELLGLFQPAPALAPIFDAAIAATAKAPMGDRLFGALGKLLLGYAPSVGLGAAPGLALALIAALSDAPWGWAVAALVTLPLGVLVSLLLRLRRAFTHDLPQNGFGLCSGATMAGSEAALTPWLSALFNGLAGKKGAPLTFGDLARHDLTGDELTDVQREDPAIDLQVMTTCLGQSRPYRLPFTTNIFMWKESEFRELFGDEIVNFMIPECDEVSGHPGYRWFPRAAHLPVVVAVRMSLSFPVLLSAVPLYTNDRTLRSEEERQVPQRCWFSDGGICSNFPIHFFDSAWPSRPTFGISLEPHLPASHAEDLRVILPKTARSGIIRPLRPIGSMFAFLGAIIDTMQEWRDVLQGCLPGYRERVATVLLHPGEGGLNLAMPPPLVEKLAELGKTAGSRLANEFSFDRHRWRRHLVFTAKLEEILETGLERYTVAPPHGETLEAFLARYAHAPEEYKQTDAWLRTADQDLRGFIELARAWGARKPKLAEGEIPRPKVAMRITPKV